MAKVKLNYAEFENVQEHIEKAGLIMEEIEAIWGQNFDNLYNNFITNGFLEDLYKDAESQYYNWANAGYVVSYTAAGFGTGAAIGGVAGSVVPGLGNIAVGLIGGIIGAVIGLFCGITHCIQNPTDIKWCYDSKNVFENLLYNCALGDDDSYIAIENLKTKIENMVLALIKIKTKVNEFSQLYANLNATAVESGIKTILADDGTTLLGIETEVVIDGQTVTMSTSEALNAYYTYSNTVMSTEISADYLQRTYGYEINYNDIVKNANGFMTNTISSGLYTHEFIMGVLPSYTPSINSAYDAITGATGVDLDKIQSTLNNNALLAGNVALFGGLLGGALIGKVATPKSDEPSNPSSNNPGGSGDGNGGNGGNGGGSGSTPSNPTDTDKKDDVEKPTEKDETEKEEDKKQDVEEPSNDIKIDPVVDIELPKEIKVEIEDSLVPNYDDLAKQKFEFEGEYDDLLAYRDEIIQDIETKYDMGDFESIRNELKEYGYNDQEINYILEDKFVTIKAIISGDQNAKLAQMAKDLAKLDGIDYVSKYDTRVSYEELMLGEPSRNFMLASEDKQVVGLYENMTAAKEQYQTKVTEVNSLLSQVSENKQSMESIYNKYSEEYGEDTTKWTEEAAVEYKNAVDAYNISVNNASEQIKSLDESKNGYLAARNGFETARENYYRQSIENYRKANKENDVSVSNPGTNSSDIEKQIEDSIKIDDDSIVIRGEPDAGLNPVIPDVEIKGINPVGNDIQSQIENSINISGDTLEIG